MQEKKYIMVVRCELKIPSLGITVRHHSAGLMMPNSYPRDGIFNHHLTIIKDSYILLATSDVQMMSETKLYFSATNDQNK